MRPAPEEHNQEHVELIHRLVEGELEGKRKQAAESQLLACLGCLEEYNSYRRFWRTATGDVSRQAQEEYLRQLDAEAYHQYTEVMKKLAITAPAYRQSPVDRLEDFLRRRLFNRPLPTAGLLFVFLLVLPYFVYQFIALRGENMGLQEMTRHYERRLAAQPAPEKLRAETRAQYEGQIAAFHQRMAELLQPETATSYSISPQRRRGRYVPYPPVKLAKGVKFLILTIGLESAYTNHFIEIVEATGETRWQKSGVRAEEEALLLVIPREFFRKDRYEIVIYGVAPGGERKLITRFPLRIEHKT